MFSSVNVLPMLLDKMYLQNRACLCMFGLPALCVFNYVMYLCVSDVQLCVYVYVYVCMYVCIYIYIYIYVCVCVCVRVLYPQCVT